MEFKLRPFTMDDVDSLAKHANNPRIAMFLTDAFPHPYTKEDAVRFITLASKDNPARIFAIEVNGEVAGGIGIHPQADIYKRNAELGYWLAEHYWGKGIISKAIPLAVKIAFENYDIDRVFARPFSTNGASQRVLEKAGFALEARFEKTLIKNGELIDELVYAIRKQK